MELSRSEMFNVLTKSDNTGLDLGGSASVAFPSELLIVNGKSTFTSFDQAESAKITRADNGKMYAKKKVNTLADFTEAFEGTVLKTERGWELRTKFVDGKGGEIVAAGTGAITDADRDTMLAETPNTDFVRMMKVALCPYSAVEAKEVLERGESPIVLVTIKGTRWEEWFKAETEMNKKALASSVYGNKPAKELFASCFKMKVTTKEGSAGGNTWHVFSFDVELNKPEDAIAYKELVDLAQERSFYYVPKRDGVVESTFEEIEKTSEAEWEKSVKSINF